MSICGIAWGRLTAVWAAVGLAVSMVGGPSAIADDSPARSDVTLQVGEGSVPADSALGAPESAEGSVPADSEDAEGFGEGLFGGSELDDGEGDGGGVPSLGPAEDGLGVGDVLGEDGVYSWDDGGRVIGVRRVGAATADGVDAAVQGGAPGGVPDPAVEHPNATGGEWFVTDTGQLLQLHEGVIVVFGTGTSPGVVEEVLARHGVSLADATPIGGMEGGFVVSVSAEESLSLAAGLGAEPEVAAASPNWQTPNTVEQIGGRSPSGEETGGSLAEGLSDAQRKHCTGYAPKAEWVYSDELHHCAWHFDASTSYRAYGSGEDPKVDINIGNAWDRTKGQGVHIAIVDHHWNGNHEDLRDNVDLARSTDWGGHTSEPSWWRKGLFLHHGQLAYGRYLYTERHGTQVAGVAGARDNEVGSRGVAPRAKLVNFNLLDDDTAARFLESWTGHSNVIGVSNHSYTAGRLANLKRASNTWWTAVDNVLTNGLGGLGTVFTMSAGNSRNNGYYGGFSVLDERKSHRGVMTICAVGPDGTQASYSNEGPNLWLCAPSRAGSSGIGIITTEGSNGYVDTFGGTSAAAPQVAGVAALVRSVNPQLTWRDVRVLLADTAQRNHSANSSWQAGAAKYSDPNSNYQHSHKYGFGVVDAKAAVDKAFAWPLLPAEKTSRTESTGAAASLSNGTRRTEFTLNVTTGIDFVEHVYLELDMTTEKLREFEITLISPSGRESQMLTHAPNCFPPNPSYHNCPLSGMFRFGTVRHLGENPGGAWKLRFDYRGTLQQTASTIATLNSWALSIHGHTKAPLVVAPGVSFTVGTGNTIGVTLAEGDSLTITANLHNSTPTQDLTVPLAFARQSAAGYTGGSADFAAASVTFPAGQTSATTTVTIVDDTLPEGDEVFAVRADLTGYHTLGLTSTITVEDHDDGPPPKVWIEGGPTVTEGSDATFTITVVPGTPTSGVPATLPVIVEVTQSGDPGAAIGTRTVLVPLSAPADGTARFTVTTTDDNEDESHGTVIATVQPDPAYTIEREAASVEIKDNDRPPEVTISGGTAVTEGQDATFTITATPAIPASDTPATLPVVVKVTQSGDFGTATGTRTITLTMNPTTGGSAQFTVATTDDYADESHGTVIATVQPDPAYVLGGTRAASVDVEDDDQPLTVTISGGAAVTEGSTATFAVTALPATPTSGVPATLPVTVRVTQSGDFGTATGTRTITIPLSQTTGGTATFTVTTTDDDFDEPDGAVRAAVQPGTGYILGGVSTARVDTLDDDPTPPRVSISGGPGVTEGADATFTLTATPSDPASGTPATLPVTVEVTQMRDPGAALGTRTVTIVLSQATGGSAQFTVTTTDDEVDERDGIVLASVRPGQGYILGDVPVAGVGVVDDDDPGPAVTVSGGGSVTEGGDAVFTVSASPKPSAPLPVKLSVSQGGDFGVTTGTRTVTVPTGGSVTVTVGTTDDHRDEADGSVSVSVQAGGVYRVGSPSSARVAVADDDPTLPEISVTGGPGIAEGQDATFTVSAFPAPTGPLPVNVSVSAVGDYGADLTLKSVTVPTGGSVTVTVSTVADQVDDVDGSVFLAVESGTGYTVSASAGSATVAVTDDGPATTPVISVTADGDVTEGGDATFTVSAAPKPSGPLPVKLSVSQTGDYGVVSGARMVTVPTGGSVTVTVDTDDDSIDEADGSVTVTVQSGSGYTVSATVGAVTVNIADNDDPSTGYTVDSQVVTRVKALAAQVQHGTAHVNRWQRVLVAFGELDAAGVSGGPMTAAQARQMADTHSSPVWDLVVVELTALEAAGTTPVISITGGAGITEGGSVTFTVSASPNPAAGLSVKLSVSQVGDWGVTTGTRTVTVPTGGTLSVSILTTDDSTDETDGSVTITVVAGSGYTVSGSAGSATVSVSDNDDPPVVTPEVSVTSGGDVTEGGDAVFTVSASPAPTTDLPVKVSVTAVGDYGITAGTRTVTITAGATSKKLALSTTDDQTDETGGSVTATLDTGSAYTIDATAGSATVSISDDDDPPPVIPVVSVTAGADVTEGGSATFTVTASPAPTADLTVSMTVTTSGDYGITAGARSVIISAGVSSAKLTLSTTDDSTDETGGSVSATLDTGSAYTIDATAGSATVSLADDDDPPATAVSLSLSASAVSVAEAGGEAKITITLGRALRVGEWVRASLAITGGVEGDHWTLDMRSGDNPAGGAWRTGYGAETAVLFYGGGRTATLTLTARPNTDTATRAIAITFGTGRRAPTSGGLDGGITIDVETVTITIVNDD